MGARVALIQRQTDDEAYCSPSTACGNTRKRWLTNGPRASSIVASGEDV